MALNTVGQPISTVCSSFVFVSIINDLIVPVAKCSALIDYDAR